MQSTLKSVLPNSRQSHRNMFSVAVFYLARQANTAHDSPSEIAHFVLFSLPTLTLLFPPLQCWELVIDRYISQPILSADSRFFTCIAIADQALFTDRHPQAAPCCWRCCKKWQSRKPIQFGSILQSIVLPHLFLIFVKYCLLVPVLPHLF